MRVLRVDVRDAVAVAHDLGALLEAEEPELAVGRRQRAVHEDEELNDEAEDDEDRKE